MWAWRSICAAQAPLPARVQAAVGIPCVRLNTNTPPRAAASPAARSCGDRTQTSGAVLLNDIHRVAQGFTEWRVEPEISWWTRLQRQHPP